MDKMIAIIGETCSGKSDLAIKVAKKINANIFSIDSLSIYKQIDIASAKPSKQDLQEVKHFGIDVLEPNKKVDVGFIIDLLADAMQKSKKEQKRLIITGGSSFYLKTFVSGISDMPALSKDNELFNSLKDRPLEQIYSFLKQKDSKYMEKISKNDTYRIFKALSIYAASNEIPSVYFSSNKPIPLLDNINIYSIQTQKEELIKNITLRTKKMIDLGILEETKGLIQMYGDDIKPLKAIGPKECKMHLEGKINLQELIDLIIINTKKLAKRQRTFNKHQFNNIKDVTYESLPKDLIYEIIINAFKDKMTYAKIC